MLKRLDNLSISSFARQISLARRAVVLSIPLLQDFLIPDARLKEKLYRIAFFVLHNKSDSKVSIISGFEAK